MITFWYQKSWTVCVNIGYSLFSFLLDWNNLIQFGKWSKNLFRYMDISIFICWMASLCLFTVNSNVSLSIVLIGSNSSLLSTEWSPSFLRIGSRKWSKGFTTNSMQNERKDKVAPQTRIKKAAIQPETKVIHPKCYNHLKENSQHSYFFIQSSMYSHTKTLKSERNDSWLGRWLEFLCTCIY